MTICSETLREAYQAPALRVLPLIPENAICESAVLPGGNEDIGYEDWD